jgi:serine/threonine protein kinase
MEYLGGGTLRELLRAETGGAEWWDGTRKAIVVAQIVLGMEFIHSKGLIHRDLKPENILLDDDHNAKISDLGSCREYTPDVSMTNPVGTLLYMAPEVFGWFYDQKADVYSFALILYEIVTGNGIFSGQDNENKRRLYGDLRAGERPVFPEDVLAFAQSLIGRCWSSKRSERPSFSEIWEELSNKHFKIVPGVDEASVLNAISTAKRIRRFTIGRDRAAVVMEVQVHEFREVPDGGAHDGRVAEAPGGSGLAKVVDGTVGDLIKIRREIEGAVQKSVIEVRSAFRCSHEQVAVTMRKARREVSRLWKG